MRVRVGLRVNDVTAATRFYSGLGFEPIGQVPDPHGAPVLTVLRHGDTDLVVDALEGLPFPDTPRERQTQTGRPHTSGASELVRRLTS